MIRQNSSILVIQCLRFWVTNAITRTSPVTGIHALHDEKLFLITALWWDMTSPGSISPFSM